MTLLLPHPNKLPWQFKFYISNDIKCQVSINNKRHVIIEICRQSIIMGVNRVCMTAGSVCVVIDSWPATLEINFPTGVITAKGSP